MVTLWISVAGFLVVAAAVAAADFSPFVAVPFGRQRVSRVRFRRARLDWWLRGQLAVVVEF